MDAPKPDPPSAPALRLFLAVRVPASVKARLQRAQEALRRELSSQGASWTRPEQWHLTLKFLGDVDAAQMEALCDALRSACAAFNPFCLMAAGIGCFPHWRRPRVIWAGVRDERHGLVALAAGVETAAAGFAPEPRQGNFTGHITLARLKNIAPAQADGLARQARTMAARAFGDWNVAEVELVRSKLTSAGARHSVVERFPLSEP